MKIDLYPILSYTKKMTNYINEQYWRTALAKQNWYILLQDDFVRLEELAKNENDYDTRKRIKSEAYRLVEEAVRAGTLPMAVSGDDLDIERKPIDTIVIHHTNNGSGMKLERLNAIQLLRIYGSYFANPTNPNEKHLKGQAIWSGHFYNSQQVFWGYHWLVREDGSTERILDDSYIGWHAGNWDINTRSVGICIDDDLTDKEPGDAVIRALTETIREHYPAVSASNIKAHCDVYENTQCPGHLFHESWRQKLIAELG